MKHLFFLYSVLFSLLLTTSRTQAQWVQLNGPSHFRIHCFAVKGQNLYAGTQLGGIFRSSDNGISWTALNSGLSDTTVYEIVVSGPNLFAGTLHGGIFLSTDNGTNWTAVNNGIKTRGSVNALIATDPNASTTTLFAETFGSIFRSTDEGTSWAKADSGLATATANVFAVNGNNIFTGIAGSTVFRSTNNGTSWFSAGIGVIGDVYCFAVIGKNLFAGTVSHSVFVSNDNGNSWTTASNGMPRDTGVSAFAESDTSTASPMLFAASFDGNIYLSRDNGVSWTLASTGISNSALGFASLAVSGQYILAETYDGGLWRRPLSDFSSTGVLEINNHTFSIQLSPNPTYGSVSVNGTIEKILNVTVINLLGETVMELKNPHSPDFILDLSKLIPGTYYIRLSSANSVVTKKVIKN